MFGRTIPSASASCQLLRRGYSSQGVLIVEGRGAGNLTARRAVTRRHRYHCIGSGGAHRDGGRLRNDGAPARNHSPIMLSKIIASDSAFAGTMTITLTLTGPEGTQQFL